jgi:hypothetical protein
MRKTRWMATLLSLAAISIAGCGGARSEVGAEGAHPIRTVRVVQSTPQSAVQTYMEGALNLDGSAICSVIDHSLQQQMIRFAVSNRLAAAGGSCATTLGRFARVLTSPKERLKTVPLPSFHVETKDATAVVRYIGTLHHQPHTIVLVKDDTDWLIDKIDNTG